MAILRKLFRCWAFPNHMSHRRWKRRCSVSAEVEFLENRTLLTVPTILQPIDDLTVYQDQVHRIAVGLDSPLYATSPPGDFERLFIVEKTGQIRILDLNSESLLGTPFLNLPDSNLSTDGERGLLGLAFHPDYQSNGLFFVNFTDANGTTVIGRYQVSAGNPDVAEAGSGQTIFTLEQPFANHNGGWMGFGPDGFLYISSGDGGGANDPENRAQNLEDLHGKILRIDVNGDDFPDDPNRNYAIPTDNPFVGTVGRDEVWAYGLRNPWRPSFDSETGDLYIADVGQSAREEVNFQAAGSAGGENYGWRLREGSIATPGVGGPRPAGAVDPVYDYLRGSGLFQGRSVTGGYVYRGPIEEYQGDYIFGDFVSEQIWSLRVNANTGELVPGSLTDLTGRFGADAGSIDLISSFGQDAAGNLYVVDFTGEIFQVVPQVSDTYLIDLSRVFSDPEGDDSYEVTANSNTSSVGTNLSGTQLRLSFDRVVSQNVEITVRAMDPGGDSITETFLVRFQIPGIAVVGPGPGDGPVVRVLDAVTQSERLRFFAYDSAFMGGVRVAAGDVSGDGIPDIITVPGPGGGPHVKVFNGLTGEQLSGPIGDFFAYDSGFTGGLYVATADVNLDGRLDLITGADAGGGPHVRVFNALDGRLLLDFFAFDSAFAGGVRVAAGDASGDGRPDIIAAAGPGGGPHVRIFDGGNGQQIAGPLGSFFPYDLGFTGGVYVSAADLDGDDRAEVITGAGAGGGPHVKIFRASDGALFNSFFAFASGFTGGVRVGVNEIRGRSDVLVAAGLGGGPQVRVFDGRQLAQGTPSETTEIGNAFVYDMGFAGGVFVAGATPISPLSSTALMTALLQDEMMR